MTTRPPSFVPQCYDAAASSTSPSTVVQFTTVREPSSLMRNGTSFLSQGAALLVFLVHEDSFTRGKIPRATWPHRIVAQTVATVPTARSSEMVKTITRMFGLNRSQAADVMQVRRQSVYNWISGAEAEGANLERMVCLYGIAKSLANPVEPHLAVRSTADGTNSLLRMLSANQLDCDAILTWTNALQKVDDVPWPQPLESVLREAGIERHAERDSQRGADGVRYLQG